MSYLLLLLYLKTERSEVTVAHFVSDTLEILSPRAHENCYRSEYILEYLQFPDEFRSDLARPGL